jgi:PPOX class probable F420-dependent enzyme
MAIKIPDTVLDLLSEEKKAFAFVATTMPDGTPQVTPVWIDYDGQYVIFNTAIGRVKERNLREHPTVAIAILDPDNPYRYVQIRGRAELIEPGADAHIDKMAKKYLGVDKYPYRRQDERRIIVRVTPEQVQTNG